MTCSGGTLTAFGTKCRQLRAARGLLMSQQSQALGISSASISSVETGAQPVPHGYLIQVAQWLKLSTEEGESLQSAANASVGVVNLRPKDDATAKLVIELAQTIETLTPNQIKKLRLIMSGAR